MDRTETARRMKAARALGGFGRPEDLAARINERGLGAPTIKAIEAERRDAEPSKLDRIAQACGVPPEFFSAPRWTLGLSLDELLERADNIADEQDYADVVGELEEYSATVTSAVAEIRERWAELAMQSGEPVVYPTTRRARLGLARVRRAAGYGRNRPQQDPGPQGEASSGTEG